MTVTLKDSGTGQQQSIISNRIHPYFVQLPADVTQTVPNSEGHDYQGVIERGAWVDAQHLQAGYRLLNADNSWAEVVGVSISHEPLVAYNLTVRDYHTYFVAGTGVDDAEAVWVHNDCWDADQIDDALLDYNRLVNGRPVYNYLDEKTGQIREIYQGKDGKYYDISDHPMDETGLPTNISDKNDGEILQVSMYNNKHIASKNMSWELVVEGTKSGPAKFSHDIDIATMTLQAWEKGVPVTNGKNWKVFDTGQMVGAKNGQETSLMRVELAPDGQLHGHPITQQEARNLTK